MSRLAKQLFIGGIYLALLLGVVWSGYRWAVPAPTCSDGVRNGAEEGLDCGVAACGVLCATPILPLQVSSTKILEAGTGYDVLVELKNLNPLHGASRVEYMLTVTDSADAPIATRRGVAYVNPLQSRYLVFPLSGLSAVPVGAQFRIDDATVRWDTLTVDAKGDIQFGVRNEVFTATPEGALRYSASVLNRSTFHFDAVDVTVLVYDAKGSIISANSTVQRTLLAGEERAFSMEWPFLVVGATRVQAVVTTNVFLNDNFIRAYGSPESLEGL